MENNEEDRLIKELLANYKTPEDLIGENGLLKRLTKKLVEGALGAEMTHHLGYPKHDVLGQGSGNSRNGASAKTLKGDFGEVEIEVPRDRNGSFEPKIVGKHQRRFTGFDDLGGHRCGAGRGQDLAEPAAGEPLPGDFPGRADGENAP
jgi:putative transposase